jgi:hypothetical protein
MLLDSKLNMLSSELCRSILSMDDHISFVVIIDEKGRVKESQGDNEIIKKLLGTRKEIFFMENALMHRMRTDFDVDLGEVRFTYVERARRSIFYFPMKDQLLLVSSQLISKYKKKLENIS